MTPSFYAYPTHIAPVCQLNYNAIVIVFGGI